MFEYSFVRCEFIVCDCLIGGREGGREGERDRKRMRGGGGEQETLIELSLFVIY